MCWNDVITGRFPNSIGRARRPANLQPTSDGRVGRRDLSHRAATERPQQTADRRSNNNNDRTCNEGGQKRKETTKHKYV
jgi:hypothetical protein